MNATRVSVSNTRHTNSLVIAMIHANRIQRSVMIYGAIGPEREVKSWRIKYDTAVADIGAAWKGKSTYIMDE